MIFAATSHLLSDWLSLCYLAWLLRNVLLLLYVSALAAVVLTPVVRATSHFHVGGAGGPSRDAPSLS